MAWRGKAWFGLVRFGLVYLFIWLSIVVYQVSSSYYGWNGSYSLLWWVGGLLKATLVFIFGQILATRFELRTFWHRFNLGNLDQGESRLCAVDQAQLTTAQWVLGLCPRAHMEVLLCSLVVFFPTSPTSSTAPTPHSTWWTQGVACPCSMLLTLLLGLEASV